MTNEKRDVKGSWSGWIIAGVIVVLVLGWNLDWDYKKIPDLPIARTIAGWFSTGDDLQTGKATLLKRKKELLAQQAIQREEAGQSVRTHAALDALKANLAKAIIASETSGSPVAFAGRSLTLDEAKRQLETVVNTLRIAKEDIDFRDEVLRKISEMITTVSERICQAERAISVRELTGILDGLDVEWGKYDELISQTMRPFVGPALKGGPLTEDDLLEFASRCQPSAKAKPDIEAVLSEYRTSSPATPSENVASETVDSETVAKPETAERVDGGFEAVFRVKTQGGNVLVDRVR